MAKTLYTKEVDAGALKSTSSKAYKFKLEVIENSTSEANDSSNITINFYGAKYSGWGFSQFSSPKAVIAIDSTNKTNDTVSAINSTSYVKISTWTGDIKHNAEGKKTLSVKTVFDPHLTASSGYNYAPAKTQIEASVPLTTIPQKSSVTATNAEIEGNTKIEIKRASSSFTHTLKYSFGGLTGTIATKTANTSISWTVPTSFYAKIPNAKKGTCTITCETYSDSTLIGSSTCTFEASCNESKCKPTLTATVVDTNQDTINLTGDSNKLVKYKSTAKITPTATSKNSATISKITIDGISITSVLNVEKVSKNSFEIIATDSRGFSTSLPKTIDMLDYVQLTCKADFERTSQTSNEVKLKYSGNYFNGSFGAQNNTLAMSWSYCEKGTNDWISGGILNPTISGNTFLGETSCGNVFNYKKDYEFKLYYADELDSLDLTKDVSKGEGSLEIYDKALVVNGEDLVTWYDDKLNLGENLYLNGNRLENKLSFCRAYANGQINVAATDAITVTSYTNTTEIGDFKTDPTSGALVIPKGTKVIETSGLLAGSGYCRCGLLIRDEDDNPVQYEYSSSGILIQFGGNGYGKTPLPTTVFELDETKSYTIKLSVRGYNNRGFGINNGFANETYIQAKKLM